MALKRSAQSAPDHPETVAVLVLRAVVPFGMVIPEFVFGDTKPHGGVAYYRMVLCSDEPGLVPMVGGTPVGIQRGLEVLRDAHTVVIPGRSPADTPVTGEVLAALRDAAARGARLVSICTGSFVLAAAGLLDGRRATTHWAHAENLARKYPRVTVDPRVLYVEDGPVFTSAGMAAGIDLCLHVVRTDHGAEVANAIARRMVVAPHRTGGQAQFIEQPVPVTRDEALQRVQEWALERLHEPLTVEQLARRANMSPRHFTRRFQSELGTAPLKWLLAERVGLHSAYSSRLTCQCSGSPSVPDSARRSRCDGTSRERSARRRSITDWSFAARSRRVARTAS